MNLPRPGPARGNLRDVRDAFEERAEEVSASACEDPEMRRLAGLLWSCTDIMPRALCATLDLPQGSTYAQAARAIKRAADATT